MIAVTHSYLYLPARSFVFPTGAPIFCITSLLTSTSAFIQLACATLATIGISVRQLQRRKNRTFITDISASDSGEV